MSRAIESQSDLDALVLDGLKEHQTFAHLSEFCRSESGLSLSDDVIVRTLRGLIATERVRVEKPFRPGHRGGLPSRYFANDAAAAPAAQVRS